MSTDVQVRPFSGEDAHAVLALAVRLTEGVAPWRDADGVRAAVEKWVAGSVTSAGEQDSALFVAADASGVVGFVSVGSTTHWSGETDAYIAELVAAQDRRGIGRALLVAAERWARDHGYTRLQLETGAANLPALRFYERHGYHHEDVRLSKPLDPPGST